MDYLRGAAISDGTSSERGRQERGEDAPEEEIFHRVIDALVPCLHTLAYQPHVINVAEDPIEPSDALALFVLRGALVDDVEADPAVDRRPWAACATVARRVPGTPLSLTSVQILAAPKYQPIVRSDYQHRYRV
jgi:hypothetical protein